MNRDKAISSMGAHYELIIIGGGATGLGCALDAASRGLKTLLLEGSDFAKASSSRSTKLIHGGLRYLQQGDISLVMEALSERGTLCENAPHLITHRPFIIPHYRFWERPFYGIGLKIYDLLAKRHGIEPSYHLSKEETIKALPTLNKKGLRGATCYYDGQFDDARLAITLARTAFDRGATLINYAKVESLIKKEGKVIGVHALGKEIYADHVINATGIFTDEIRALDDPSAKPFMIASQGVHIVLPLHFLRSSKALLIPHTKDDRLLFLVPWENRLLAGTTERAVDTPLLDPLPLSNEIDFILETIAPYLEQKPKRNDILSSFAGLRPLVNPSGTKNTKSLSRGHYLTESESGLITITGGKWTTYRKMAEDTIDRISRVPSITKNVPLHGYDVSLDPHDHWSRYGNDKEKVQALGTTLLSKNLPYTDGEVIWAARFEMAITVEDVLSRRTRALLLDANEAIKIAPRVAAILARELTKDKAWEVSEVENFTALTKSMLPL